MIASPEAVTTGSRRAWWAPAGVVLLHLGLLAHFLPPSVGLGREPLATVDYALHGYQVDRALKSFRQAGELWSWDPHLLAGQPAGVIEDLTSKGTELWVIGLTALGLAPGFAYNLLVFLTLATYPWVAWCSARLVRASHAEASVAMLLWVLLVHFDSFFRWSWWVGMFSWMLASSLTVLGAALAYRAAVEPRARWFAALAVLMPALAITHPFAAFAVGPPYLAAWWVGRRQPRVHAGWALPVMLAGATALVWWAPLHAFRHLLGDVDVFFRPTLSYVLFDTLDLVKDGRQTGVPLRTAFRAVALVAGGAVLVRWWRQGDARAWVLGALTVGSLLFAYLGGYVGAARQTQPYRQIAPAALGAALPAAVLLVEVLSPTALRALAPRARWLAALLALVAVPRLVRDVLYYVPELLPKREVHGLFDRVVSPLELPYEPYPNDFRPRPAPPSYRAVRDWLQRHHGGRGRVFVGEWVLAEYLATWGRVPVLGGIPERPIPHVDAHLLRRYPAGDVPRDELAAYLQRFAVGFVIVGGVFLPFESHRDLLVPAESVEGFRIYRVAGEPSYAERGSAVVQQSLNLLEVTSASGAPDLVLRFHWLDSLRCRPGCRVERVEVPGARAGFLRIPEPPERFEIYNSYELPRR